MENGFSTIDAFCVYSKACFSGFGPAIAWKLRIEHAGAVYHGINRRNYRANVFGDVEGTRAFEGLRMGKPDSVGDTSTR